MTKKKLGFILNPKDGWPPTDIEHLWLDQSGDVFTIMNFPLFVKGIAYKDQINLTRDASGYVVSWKLVKPSGNSLIWIYERESTDVLDKLNDIGCGVESGNFTKLAAVNVPANTKLDAIELILKPYEDSEQISVAFPVDRFQRT
jgi:Domain of unknown function (DUF4265)